MCNQDNLNNLGDFVRNYWGNPFLADSIEAGAGECDPIARDELEGVLENLLRTVRALPRRAGVSI